MLILDLTELEIESIVSNIAIGHVKVLIHPSTNYFKALFKNSTFRSDHTSPLEVNSKVKLSPNKIWTSIEKCSEVLAFIYFEGFPK